MKTQLILEMDVETVGDLIALLSQVSPQMPVSDAVGELLNVRVYVDPLAGRHMEFQ